jgi:Neuraminidase (sialidase)
VGCTPDFYQGHATVSADAKGGLVYLYDGATVAGGMQSIYASRSTDHGLHWTTPTVVSATGEESTAPMMESGAKGDVRIAWMQTSGGGNVDAWNTIYRRSSDGGATWSAPVRISDATSGAPYKSAAGYAEVYGDYGEMAITNTGKSIATWGEGISYTGPGGVWVNRER